MQHNSKFATGTRYTDRGKEIGTSCICNETRQCAAHAPIPRMSQACQYTNHNHCDGRGNCACKCHVLPDVRDITKILVVESGGSEYAIIWRDAFCHECETNVCLEGTAQQLAEKIHSLGWSPNFSNLMCPACQD